MLEIDGNHLEGGGQIIRTAIALSTLTNRPCRIYNIRKKRNKPGLKNQHLAAIDALKTLCNAEVTGNTLGSNELIFHPNKIEPKNIDIDIKSAGSITLLLQALLLPCILATKPIKITIIGGTIGLGQMPIEYFKAVFIPHIKKYVEEIDVNIIKRGYYPKGKGVVEIVIKPKFHIETTFDEFIEDNKEDFKKIVLLKQGYLIQIKAISHSSLDLEKKEITQRQARAAKLQFKKLRTHVHINEEYQSTLSTGTGITCHAIFSLDEDDIDSINPIILGGSSYGELRKSAERVGTEAANELIKSIKSKAPVDKYLADNLIPFLAIFGGRIKVEKITNHTRANIWVCEQFLGKIFEINEKERVIKRKDYIREKEVPKKTLNNNLLKISS